MLCFCWTAARRAPLAFRRIGDLKVPFTITLTQLLIWMVLSFSLFSTRRFWTWMLPGVGVAVVMVGLPLLVSAAFGSGRIEGRGLPRYLRGLIRYHVSRTFRKDPSKQVKSKYHLRLVVMES